MIIESLTTNLVIKKIEEINATMCYRKLVLPYRKTGSSGSRTFRYFVRHHVGFKAPEDEQTPSPSVVCSDEGGSKIKNIVPVEILHTHTSLLKTLRKLL